MQRFVPARQFDCSFPQTVPGHPLTKDDLFFFLSSRSVVTFLDTPLRSIHSLIFYMNIYVIIQVKKYKEFDVI